MAKWYLPSLIDEFKIMKYLLDNIDTDGGYQSDYVFQADDLTWCDPDASIGLVAFDKDGLMRLKVKNLPATIEKLIIGGFIERPFLHEGTNIIEIPITGEGRFCFSALIRKSVSFVVCSVLVPIAVSFITALLTVCH